MPVGEDAFNPQQAQAVTNLITALAQEIESRDTHIKVMTGLTTQLRKHVKLKDRSIQQRAELKAKLDGEMVTYLAGAGETLSKWNAANGLGEKRAEGLSDLCQTVIERSARYVEISKQFYDEDEAGKGGVGKIV